MEEYILKMEVEPTELGLEFIGTATSLRMPGRTSFRWHPDGKATTLCGKFPRGNKNKQRAEPERMLPWEWLAMRQSQQDRQRQPAEVQ